MLSKSDVVDFLRAFPGSNTTEMARHFGVRTSRMSVTMCELMQQGRVSRVMDGKNINGTTNWVYSATNKATPSVPGRKTTQNNAKAISHGVSIESMVNDIANALAGQIAAAMMPALQHQIQSRMSALLPPPTVVVQSKVEQVAEQVSQLQEEVVAPQEISKPVPIEQVAKRAVTKVVATAKRKEKVLIVGMIPGQCGLLSDEFHDVFDLSFFTVDESLQKLGAMAAGADIVFIHLNHVSHKHQNTVAAANKNYKLIGGGMSSMRDALTNHYCKEAA